MADKTQVSFPFSWPSALCPFSITPYSTLHDRDCDLHLARSSNVFWEAFFFDHPMAVPVYFQNKFFLALSWQVLQSTFH
jgi:hypothetical protein